MTLPGTLTGGGATWTSSGINAPSSEEGANGVWYGVTQKKAGGGIFFCVWQEVAPNQFALRWNGPSEEHRGTMQAQGGRLIVTIYVGSGDNQPTERIVIPGFVPLPSAATGPQGPQGVPGPMGPQGPAGSSGGGGGLSARYTQALERLCAWLGIP